MSPKGLITMMLAARDINRPDPPGPQPVWRYPTDRGPVFFARRRHARRAPRGAAGARFGMASPGRSPVRPPVAAHRARRAARQCAALSGDPCPRLAPLAHDPGASLTQASSAGSRASHARVSTGFKVTH